MRTSTRKSKGREAKPVCVSNPAIRISVSWRCAGQVLTNLPRKLQLFVRRFGAGIDVAPLFQFGKGQVGGDASALVKQFVNAAVEENTQVERTARAASLI